MLMQVTIHCHPKLMARNLVEGDEQVDQPNSQTCWEGFHA